MVGNAGVGDAGSGSNGADSGSEIGLSNQSPKLTHRLNFLCSGKDLAAREDVQVLEVEMSN